MSIRRDPIYLSYDVWRELRLLAKAQTDEGNIVTADQVADDMLRQVLTERYPQLQKHQKDVAKLERDLIKTLGAMKHDTDTSKYRQQFHYEKQLLVDQSRTQTRLAARDRHHSMRPRFGDYMDALKDSTCEFPKPTGDGICGAPATQVVTFHGFRWSYSCEGLPKCAAYAEKEARTNAGRDR